MTYSFPQFKVNITDPNVTVVSVNDSITSKTCSVDILLTTDSAEFGVTLSGFTYVDTWEDADITDWVNTKLQEFES